MSELSQQLRELAAKATQALAVALTAVDGGESQSKIDELRSEVGRINDNLAYQFMQHRETILSALELQERLDAPETVEVVARAISGAPFPSQASIRKAQAALAALKGDQ